MLLVSKRTGFGGRVLTFFVLGVFFVLRRLLNFVFVIFFFFLKKQKGLGVRFRWLFYFFVLFRVLKSLRVQEIRTGYANSSFQNSKIFQGRPRTIFRKPSYITRSHGFQNNSRLKFSFFGQP